MSFCAESRGCSLVYKSSGEQGGCSDLAVGRSRRQISSAILPITINQFKIALLRVIATSTQEVATKAKSTTTQKYHRHPIVKRQSNRRETVKQTPIQGYLLGQPARKRTSGIHPKKSRDSPFHCESHWREDSAFSAFAFC